MTFPHRPPPHSSPVRRFLWRQRVWFEATFGLAMLDTWEIVMVYSLLTFLTSFLLLSIIFYLPTHVSFLRRRAAYYIWGDEAASLFGVSIDPFDWLASLAGQAVGTGKAMEVLGEKGVEEVVGRVGGEL